KFGEDRMCRGTATSLLERSRGMGPGFRQDDSGDRGEKSPHQFMRTRHFVMGAAVAFFASHYMINII
ncbi:hypothetical protein, partial [Escherichia coli]|uniref:hypothetical protein n=1 Tax=Escherichia coli TaxID=562 RepID=UPI001BDC5CEC